MHICHVVSGLFGGPEVLIAQLASAQRRAGHRLTIVYSSLRDDLTKSRHLFPDDVTFLPWRVRRDVSLRSDWGAYRELRGILGGVAPDIVHLHCAKAGAHGRVACSRLGFPSIYSPHGLPYARLDIGATGRRIYYSIEWILALAGNMTVACSAGEFEAIKKLPGKKALINNSIDIDAINVAISDRVVIPRASPFRIAIVGRIEPQKNPHLVADLARRTPDDWEWIWVGDGAERAIVERDARVKITGWLARPEVLAMVRSSDVLLQATRWEGMPFSVLEAMALKRPCVVSKVSGNRDLITDGVSGFVCGSVEDYVRALMELAKMPDRRVALGEGAFASISRDFDLNAAISRWAELYSRLLAGEADIRV